MNRSLWVGLGLLEFVVLALSLAKEEYKINQINLTKKKKEKERLNNINMQN